MNEIDVNVYSKSSNYGRQQTGKSIYAIISNDKSGKYFVGKKNIESILSNMSRSEIDRTLFYLNCKISSVRSSWIPDVRFMEIYESAE